MTPPTRPAASRTQPCWYGLMAAGGLLFGLLGDKRPFGASVLAHPFVLFFAVVAAALLILRVARGRPVPELIPERAARHRMLRRRYLVPGRQLDRGSHAGGMVLIVRAEPTQSVNIREPAGTSCGNFVAIHRG